MTMPSRAALTFGRGCAKSSARGRRRDDRGEIRAVSRICARAPPKHRQTSRECHHVLHRDVTGSSESVCRSPRRREGNPGRFFVDRAARCILASSMQEPFSPSLPPLLSFSSLRHGGSSFCSPRFLTPRLPPSSVALNSSACRPPASRSAYLVIFPICWGLLREGAHLTTFRGGEVVELVDRLLVSVTRQKKKSTRRAPIPPAPCTCTHLG